MTDYRGGAYWAALWEAADFRAHAAGPGNLGARVQRGDRPPEMEAFPGLPLPYLGPILMHAGIPASCLGDYFRLLLSRRRVDPGMDAEGFLAWATAPGRDSRLAQLNKPARRFLRHAGATTPTTSWTARSTCSTGSSSRMPISTRSGCPAT